MEARREKGVEVENSFFFNFLHLETSFLQDLYSFFVFLKPPH
jgi:hypothetical protein